MKLLLLMLSLLFSANLFCEDSWEFSGPTYEDILWSSNIPGLEKEKAKIQNELAQCSNSTEQCKLRNKLDSIEKTIKGMEKSAEQKIANYRKEVQARTLSDLKFERDMYKRSLNVDPKHIDEIRKQTNAIIRQKLVILESEIEKREQTQ